ncbi:hypothetical protein TNCV_3623371 [Trichonephila clavipes]|nr:hypothetical protein TNCV_3623371 [Trichonephila clavipes]
MSGMTLMIFLLLEYQKQQTDETDHHSKDKTMSHINKAEPQPNEKTVNKTRSGRHVRFPKDLEQYIT